MKEDVVRPVRSSVRSPACSKTFVSNLCLQLKWAQNRDIWGRLNTPPRAALTVPTASERFFDRVGKSRRNGRKRAGGTCSPKRTTTAQHCQKRWPRGQ